MARLRRRSQHSVGFSHKIRPQHRLPRRQRWSRNGRRAGIGVAALAALFFPASALASSTSGPKPASDIPAFANLKIAGLPSVTASAPGRFSAWYRDTGEPVLGSLVRADNDLARGQYLAGCSMIESVASKALAQPYPPDPALAYHWAAALTFNITGAGECLQAQREKNSSLLRSAAGYITDGAGQLSDSTSAIQALK